MTLLSIGLRITFFGLCAMGCLGFAKVEDPGAKVAEELTTCSSKGYDYPLSRSAGGRQAPRKLDIYDAILIRCPLRPALESTVVLDGLGVGNLPFGKRMVLAGLTIDEATSKVRAFFEGDLGAPLGSLKLERIRNPSAPVRLSGEVKSPGATFGTKGRKLSEVLTESQPTDMADLSAVEIQSGEDILIVDSTRADPELRPGDRVFVSRIGRVRQVFVLGAVRKPGAVDFFEGITAKKAVGLSGGASAPGDLSQVRIDRDGKSLGTLDFSFGDAPLRAGDTVTVPYRVNAPYVMVIGGARKPGRIYYEEGLTLRNAIEQAGGAKYSKGKINVVRLEAGRRTVKTFDLAAVLSGQAPDVLLKGGDRVELPEGPP